MIEAINLTKKYDNGHTALENLNLKVEAGEIFCMLGANGAGKTTTVNILLNFINPTAGTAKIDNLDVVKQALEVKKVLTYIPEQVMLYNNLTGIENLDYFTKLSNLKYSKQELLVFLERAGLKITDGDKKVLGYSKGMRQKVGIAFAIAKNAKVLILDEPTSGLDPKSSYEFSELIISMRNNGVTIFMVTHDLFRIKEMNAKVGIMKSGKLLTTFNSEEFNHSDIEKIYLDYISK